MNNSGSNSGNVPKRPPEYSVKLVPIAQRVGENLTRSAQTSNNPTNRDKDPQEIVARPPTMPEKGPEILREGESIIAPEVTPPAPGAAVGPIEHVAPKPPVCAECGTPWGWLRQDPFRPDRWLHEQCAGGYRLQFPEGYSTAPATSNAGYKYTINETPQSMPVETADHAIMLKPEDNGASSNG